MLAGKHRLTRSLFNQTRLEGRVSSYLNITLRYTSPSKAQISRFSVVVPKKGLKSNTERNLIRRRLYEVIQSELPKLKPIQGIVFWKNTPDHSFEYIQKTLKNIFKKEHLS
jgi:ribonuclease P protein component